MESGAILDSEISASSQYDSNNLASQGRMNFQGGWRAAAKDVNQWLQIDLGKGFANVTRVGTQGRWGLSHWVTTYNLQYGHSISNFQYYKEQGQNKPKVRNPHFLNEERHVNWMLDQCFWHWEASNKCRFLLFVLT